MSRKLVSNLVVAVFLCGFMHVNSVAPYDYTEYWNGPGWYEVYWSHDMGAILEGPFKNSTYCEKSLEIEVNDISWIKNIVKEWGTHKDPHIECWQVDSESDFVDTLFDHVIRYGN